MKRSIGLAVAMVVVAFGVCGSAGADESVSSSYMDGSLRKLGRGIANIATCPAEIVRTASLVGRDEGVVAESSKGVVKGVWNMVVRGAAGVYEVASFWVETPKGFEPIVKPEYVWADGSWQEQ